MKISDLLYTAADMHLTTTDGETHGQVWPRFIYSCGAIYEELNNHCHSNIELEAKWKIVTDFLSSLGLECFSFSQFIEFEDKAERQQIRHAWLYMAADYALELEEAGELQEI